MKPRRSTAAKGAKLGSRVHRPKRGKGSYRRNKAERVDIGALRVRLEAIQRREFGP